MQFKMIPCSNRIIIKEQSREEETGTFLLPENYSKTSDELQIYEFVAAGKTCVNEFTQGDKVVVHEHLIEEFKFAGEKTLMVGESAVTCIIRDSKQQ